MENWTEIAVTACEHAGIDVQSIEAIATWDQAYCANSVYRLNAQQYLKVFGPRAERQFHIERTVLRMLADHGEIPAPRIVAAGEPAYGWPYLILTAMPGVTAENGWDDVPLAEQLTIARELGAITAAIHRLPQEGLAAVERQFGGRNEHIVKVEKAKRIAEIEAAEMLPIHQRDDLLRFLHEEAPEHLNGGPKVTHFDLAHNHIYLLQDTGTWQVSGIIDWGESVLGPPEWDIVYLCFWTFWGFWRSEWDPMQVFLGTFFADQHPPERFARRCLAALLHTPSMSLLWPHFVKQGNHTAAIVRDLTQFFFPQDVFGPAD